MRSRSDGAEAGESGEGGRARLIRVYMQQPTVPEYRVRPFGGIGAEDGIALEIHASPTAVDGPDTCDHGLDFPVHMHPIQSAMGSNLSWQSGLRLPDEFEAGDVLFLSANLRYLSSAKLAMQARLRGIGVVWFGHGRPFGRFSLPLGWLRRAWTNAFVDIHLVYTHQEVPAYLDAGYPDDCVIAIDNTIDSDEVYAAAESWSEADLAGFRERENPDGNILLLFCGRLTTKTSFSIAIDALAELVSAGGGYELVVIGDGPLKESYEAHAAKLGVSDHVRWLGPIFDQRELAPWFLSASAFVYPGSIGLSIFHAFAYGLGVISHDDRASQRPEYDALNPSENGLTYRFGSSSDLAEKIREMTDPESVKRFGENARRTSKANSMDNMISNFVTAIRAASPQR